MKNKKIFLSFFAIVLLVFSGQAQKGATKISIGYSAAFPNAAFKDLINDASFRGMDLRIMHSVSDNLAIGFGTGFQDFYQKYPRQVYKMSDGSDVSAVVSNSVQTVPLLARVQYNFTPGGRIQPFAGLGAGGDMVLYRQYLGEFADSKNKFAFQAQPELGVYIPLKPAGSSGISLAGFYNIIPFRYNNTGNLNSAGFTARISFPTGN